MHSLSKHVSKKFLNDRELGFGFIFDDGNWDYYLVVGQNWWPNLRINLEFWFRKKWCCDLCVIVWLAVIFLIWFLVLPKLPWDILDNIFCSFKSIFKVFFRFFQFSAIKCFDGFDCSLCFIWCCLNLVFKDLLILLGCLSAVLDKGFHIFLCKLWCISVRFESVSGGSFIISSNLKSVCSWLKVSNFWISWILFNCVSNFLCSIICILLCLLCSINSFFEFFGKIVSSFLLFLSNVYCICNVLFCRVLCIFRLFLKIFHSCLDSSLSIFLFLRQKHLNVTDIKEIKLDLFFNLIGRDNGSNSGEE